MRHDYLRTTLPTSVDGFLREVMTVQPYAAADVLPGRALYGFQRCAAVKLGERSLVDCFHGFAGSDDVMVQCAGFDAEALASFVNARWQRTQRLSRLDSCMDFRGPDAWPMLCSVVGRIHAQYPRVRVEQIGPRFDGSGDGTTIYLGARTSRVFVRFYQKGLQPGSGYEADVCRAELEYKPQSREKMMFAGRAASDYWGLSRWTQSAFEMLLGSEVPRLEVPPLPRSDLDRRFEHMRQQYGPTFAEFSALHGVDAATSLLLTPMDDGARRVAAPIGVSGAVGNGHVHIGPSDVSAVLH